MDPWQKLYYGTVTILAAIIVVSTGLYYQNRSEPTTFFDGFEDGLGVWSPDGDLPMDPNNPGNEVAWIIAVSKEHFSTGQSSALFYIDGSQDDGTIWLEKGFDLRPNSFYEGELTFQFYSGSESFNTIAVVVGYVGTLDPEVEEHLTVLGPANKIEGWLEYACEANFKTNVKGEVWVAFGISVRWETEMVYFVDDVNIKFQPR
jgi:hypothetical protein